jgi:hypothetical protein
MTCVDDESRYTCCSCLTVRAGVPQYWRNGAGFGMLAATPAASRARNPASNRMTAGESVGGKGDDAQVVSRLRWIWMGYVEV